MPAPTSFQIGLLGKRKGGSQLPIIGANNQTMTELMKTMLISRPSVAIPRSVQAPITIIASNSAESPGNKAKASMCKC